MMLEVQGLCAGYGTSEVLFGIDLSVGPGEIIGVLGRNGMGKTTLVRCITGLLRPSAGSIQFEGRPILGLAPNAVARAGIALVPEGRQIFPNLSVEEHLSAFQRPSPAGQTKWTQQRLFEIFPRLQARRGHMGNQLSGGEQQMLAIARALVTNPALLILDEATEGLAPLVVAEIWRVIGEIRRDGIATLIVDRDLRKVLAQSDRALVLQKGQVVLSGSAEMLRQSAELTQFLGV